jgi:hypothetical protein
MQPTFLILHFVPHWNLFAEILGRMGGEEELNWMIVPMMAWKWNFVQKKWAENGIIGAEAKFVVPLLKVILLSHQWHFHPFFRQNLDLIGRMPNLPMKNGKHWVGQ